MTGRLSPVHMVRDLRFGLLIAGSAADTAENIARALMRGPPKKKWDYTKAAKTRESKDGLNSALGFLIRLIYPQSSSLLLLVL